ncbi:MAG: hypothetical protein GC134_05210 [Proteobacteria bacterium]|nr:hypothetical protein [Pseudomonadota bacterium]
MLRWVAACLTTACLLGLFTVLAAKYGRRGQLAVGSKGNRSLSLHETLWVDARHKVVKIADGQNLHTVLIAPQSTLLLQTTKNKDTKPDA